MEKTTPLELKRRGLTVSLGDPFKPTEDPPGEMSKKLKLGRIVVRDEELIPLPFPYKEGVLSPDEEALVQDAWPVVSADIIERLNGYAPPPPNTDWVSAASNLSKLMPLLEYISEEGDVWYRVMNIRADIYQPIVMWIG